MTAFEFEFEERARDPDSFNNAVFSVKSYKNGQTWITWDIEEKVNGAGVIVIPSFILREIAWMYLDQCFKSRLIMAGLKSFWDIITIAESRQRIKLYQMTPAGFKRLWGKYIKEGVL